MSTFNHLPGVQVATLDKGLVSRTVPSSKAILILGTAEQGPANEPFQIPDQATAATLFGLSGSLIRTMSEVALGGADNIILYRIGTKAATLANVGKDTASISSPGFTLQFGTVTSTVSTTYSVWYSGTSRAGLGSGVLYVWNGSQLVYANDIVNANVVDTGDLTITGTPSLGRGNGYGATVVAAGGPVLANAVTVAAVAATVATGTGVQPTFTAATLGTGMTGRQTFIALSQACDLLDIYPVDEVVAPDAIFDNPNIAFHPGLEGAGETINDSTVNANALDWLHIAVDAFGNKVYHWASEAVDTNGTVVAPANWSTSAQRISAGYGEVNFGHMLATFCQKQEIVGLAGTCLLFIGTSLPTSFRLSALRTWVGYDPIYNPEVLDQVGDADIQVATDGAGLLANPYLAGCTSARLNSLCIDHDSGRTAGLFQTGNGMYDGEAIVDSNGNLVDVGAYVHVVADVAVISNSFSFNYGANLANYAAGYVAVLDEAKGLTNKPANASQLWKPNSVQLDSATRIGLNFLRFKGNGNLPAFTNDQTAATNASDYKNLLRQRIKGLVVNTLRKTADPFVGSSSTDGLQLTALQTALTSQMMILQKRGYLSNFSFSVTSTPAQQRIGHATISIVFTPADELIQLDATIALSPFSNG